MTNRDDSARSRASGLLLAAAVLLMVGNMLHPVDAEPTATSRLLLATGGSWVPIHLAAGLGMLCAGLGLATLGGMLRSAGRSAGRIAAGLAAIGGAALSVVFVALDGFGASHLADALAGANVAERPVVEAAAVALEAVDTGLAGFGMLLLFGLGLVATGVAIVRERPLAAWWGWIAVVIGVAGSVTGYVLLTEGATQTTINVLLRPTAGLATFLLAGLGLALRRGRTVETASTRVQPALRRDRAVAG